MSSLLRILPIIVLLFAAACSVNPATGERSFTAFMSEEDEREVGYKEHPKILKEFGGSYRDQDLAAYVHGVGARLARVSEYRNRAFTFTVLNDETVNAFALPGGYVYVTRGLLALVDDEAQLAAVIAHEIGHITGRHTAQRYSKAKATNLGINALGVVAGLFGAPPGLSTLASVGAEVYLKGYSREQEMEADMLGVRYLANAGYHTGAMTGFFEKLQAYKALEAALEGGPDEAESHSLMSTHPRTTERIRQAVQLAGVAPAANPRVGRAAYQGRIDGLVFGDDLSQGIRKGRTFIHPGLGIRFDLPPGFHMINGENRLIGRGPAGAVVVFDMADPKVAVRTGNLTEYLAKVWGRNMSLGGVETITVNHMTGATGKGVFKKKDKTFDARLVVMKSQADRLYRFIFLTPPEVTARTSLEFRRTTYSFRRLTPLEVASVKPLRVRLIAVQPGQTAAGLAAYMPFGVANLEWFLVLNGLTRDQPLAPGTAVKIVGE